MKREKKNLLNRYKLLIEFHLPSNNLVLRYMFDFKANCKVKCLKKKPKNVNVILVRKCTYNLSNPQWHR